VGSTPWRSDSGLDVLYVGGSGARERGGTIAVLLHGWGGDAGELLGLAESLSACGVRAVLPTAPLAGPNGGRAWWSLEPDDRPAWAWDDALPAGYRPRPGVTAARGMVQGLLGELTALTARPAARASSFLLAHGIDDEEIPYEAGSRARGLLARAGRDVSWHEFSGGHEIAPTVVEQLRGFLVAGV
jgi:phospholipase/carboxylesterase